MFDVSSEFEGLGSINCNQSMQGDLWFHILGIKQGNGFNHVANMVLEKISSRVWKKKYISNIRKISQNIGEIKIYIYSKKQKKINFVYVYSRARRYFMCLAIISQYLWYYCNIFKNKNITSFTNDNIILGWKSWQCDIIAMFATLASTNRWRASKGIGSTSSSKMSSKMAIKSFCSFHLSTGKYFSSQFQRRTLNCNSTISTWVNMWISWGREDTKGLVGGEIVRQGWGIDGIFFIWKFTTFGFLGLF